MLIINSIRLTLNFHIFDFFLQKAKIGRRREEVLISPVENINSGSGIFQDDLDILLQRGGGRRNSRFHLRQPIPIIYVIH